MAFFLPNLSSYRNHLRLLAALGIRDLWISIKISRQMILIDPVKALSPSLTRFIDTVGIRKSERSEKNGLISSHLKCTGVYPGRPTDEYSVGQDHSWKTTRDLKCEVKIDRVFLRPVNRRSSTGVMAQGCNPDHAIM